ncbi:hypothetical protein [Salinispira pacifica]|uniref:Uncharacterized protein n=1 Tax=Salinispira pacifica TaxID=1307761 RepID=V5WFP7_9SPIO|nr:hypothetical protein [Salinispira pacifica]AHC14637.1 hypothetical protein L21SP2_1236 [Salinispira pacifica]
MKIIINNEEMDITLEKESTLGEIFTSLQEWLSQGGLYPLSLELDDETADIVDQSGWSGRGLESIGEFHLRAGNLNQLRQQQLMVILDYINLLIQTLNSLQNGGDSGMFTKAFSEYTHVRSALPSVLRLEEESFVNDFKRLENAKAAVESAPGDEAALNEFHNRLKDLRIILLDRLQELNKPGKELNTAITLLKNIVPGLEEAGVALQTGREREAYGLMFRISETAAKFIRIMNILSIDEPEIRHDEVHRDLQKLSEIIGEMNQAISAEDTVMLADLLEYDLQELLESLIDAAQGVHAEA